MREKDKDFDAMKPKSVSFHNLDEDIREQAVEVTNVDEFVKDKRNDFPQHS